MSQKYFKTSYFQIAEVTSFLMSGKIYIALKAGKLACGLHSLYSYFLIFKYIIRAQGLAGISLSAKGSRSAIIEWRKFLVALKDREEGFAGETAWEGFQPATLGVHLKQANSASLWVVILLVRG